MSLKKILKSELIKIAKSKNGPRVQELLRGMSEIVDMEAGRAFREQMTKRLSVSNLLDNNEISISPKRESHKLESSQGKIKVRFFHCNASTFSVIQSVCECFKNDDRFDLLIVLFGNAYTGMIAQMEDKGYSYILDINYDIKVDLPDISLTYHPEIAYPPGLTHIKDYSRFFVFLPLSIGSIWFGDRTVSRLHLDSFNADICFVGNLCYDRLLEPVGADKIERMSPPQFDLAYKKFSEKKEYPIGWEKLKGKKTTMLMTDHGLKMNLISDEVTFDLYFNKLISYYKEHTNEGLILRPHFALVRELVSTYWSLDDYQSFIKFCNQSPNIVWDETSDYLTGLSISDACIVDVNCSLVYFVLAANKPVAVPLRYDMPVEINNPELVEHYYTIRSNKELENFLSNVNKGIDPMKEKRQQAFDAYIETFDGKNGQRIFDTILKRYYDYIQKNNC